MRRLFKLAFISSALVVGICSQVSAKEQVIEIGNSPITSSKPARINIQVGAYNVVRGLNNSGDAVTLFGVEYQDVPRLPYDIQVVGGALTTTNHDWFVYAGLMKEFNIHKNTALSLSFAPGYYEYGDDGKDLDNALEFKSQIGLSYELACKHRVGMSFAHISNAGLGDRNPGVEILSFNYSVPLNIGRMK